MRKTALGMLGALILASPVFAQSTTWNDLPDRFQIDAGYFGISANTVLRLDGPAGSGDVDFENDLGIDAKADTFWLDGTWRVGRRHQLKLAFTRLSRDQQGFDLTSPFTWGGQTYDVGLTATSKTSSSIIAGYYRFAIVRKDRFEIGPALGIGHLTISATIEATGTVSGPGGPISKTLGRTASTGSITGAVGGYASGWLTKRLLVSGDYLYIKVKPENSEASVTDWRVGANYYILKHAGIGVQYKYDKFRYDRGILNSELGGEIRYEGVQVFASFRF